ncbi:MAG TPA: methylenetetrahydrofolate reductase C-terminal domain-containing protein [Myxococcota bacterium]|nr:methylenetetrahydrofolate reductase C-terminal domain-containing protein [Myxococcota bacterium]
MIVAEQKPLKEILSNIEGFEKILLVGCHGCVTVCSAGGEKEVDLLAGLLRLAGRKRGKQLQVTKMTLERQCDPEYVDELREHIEQHDVVLSMACGAGVQLVAERVGGIAVLPALNTVFIGAAEEKGTWGERCQACGDCKLHLTGGICPVTRCSKSLMNGPCGGSSDGHCEIDPEVPCGWQLIVDRLEALGQLDLYERILPIPDWSSSRDGGPRKVVREDLK